MKKYLSMFFTAAAFLVIAWPYVGWVMEPDMTYMEMAISGLWNFIMGVVFAIIAIWLQYEDNG